MSLESAFAPAEAYYRAQMLGATWGHLAPKARTKYPGTILFTYGDYGDVTVIRSDFENLPDSPWFYQDQNEFVMKQVTDRGRGKVFRFSGTYEKCKTGRAFFVGTVKVVRIQ